MLFKNFRQRRKTKRLERHTPAAADAVEVMDALALWESPPSAESAVDAAPVSMSDTVGEEAAQTIDEDDTIYDDSDIELLSDISPTDVDKEFASIVDGILCRIDSPTTPGVLRQIHIVGQLRDGGWAWVCLGASAWGQISETNLGYEAPQPGDAFKARVRSYGSLHFIDAIDMHSLLRAGETRRPKPALSTGTLPQSVRGTWRASLRPGDIVVARIPFGPLASVDSTGNTSKIRPAVFVGWTEDEAVIRRVSSVGGYLERNGGVRLRFTRDLKKESVVSPTSQYVATDAISRKIARIHPTDAGTAQIPLAPEAEPTVDRPEGPPKPNPFESVISATVTDLEGSSPANDLEILGSLLRNLRHHRERLLFATLGELERLVCARLGLTRPTRKMLDRVAALSKDPHLGLVVVHDENNHPVIEFIEPTLALPTVAREPVVTLTVESREYVHPVLPDDYESPDAIILDQLGCHLMLQERRTDLAETRTILQDGLDAPSFLIGEAETESLRSFQKAAHHNGWTVARTASRQEVLDKAVEIVRTIGAVYVTVVTDRSDIVAEIEAYGCEVTVIRDWA